MDLNALLLLRFEIILSLLVLVLLIMKLVEDENSGARFFNIMKLLLGLNVIAGFLPMAEGSLFSSFFVTNKLIVFEKNILNVALLLISLTCGYWLKDNKSRIEFFILLFASMLGMFVMLSGGHVLMLYLGLEMSTIPIAALANFDANSKKSSEAGVKLILSSAFSTGILLFGISLLYASVGNLSFENIQQNLEVNPLSILAFVFIVAGFAFKMSVVPFHLWTADVYEGSPVVVTNYLAAISKASVIMVFVSVLYSIFGNLKEAWLIAISILAMLSMTIGNLFALRQDNIKRLLAFSSIAQVGFVLVGIAGASVSGMASALYFVVIYILSSIAAFAIVAIVSGSNRNESLTTYKGFYKKHPFYALVLAISLFSLAGVPPTAGFFGKLFLLTAGMANAMYVLLVVAAINLVLSLYNYLRVVKYMFVDEPSDEVLELPKSKALIISVTVCTIGIIFIGFWGGFFSYISNLSFGL